MNYAANIEYAIAELRNGFDEYTSHYQVNYFHASEIMGVLDSFMREGGNTHELQTMEARALGWSITYSHGYMMHAPYAQLLLAASNLCAALREKYLDDMACNALLAVRAVQKARYLMNTGRAA